MIEVDSLLCRVSLSECGYTLLGNYPHTRPAVTNPSGAKAHLSLSLGAFPPRDLHTSVCDLNVKDRIDMLFSTKGFKKSFNWRNVHRTMWTVANLRNWPAALAVGLWRRPVGEVEFRDGLRFKVDEQSSDLWIMFEVFGEHVYDRYFNDIDPNGTILDVGGNIGVFAVHAARDLVPQGRVIAIEPNPNSFSVMTEHLRMNQLGNVRLIQGAVASGSDPVSLHVSRQSSSDTIFASADQQKEQYVRVPVISGKDALRLSEAYELVKLDCEGGEFALLYETVPEDWIGTKRIAMEYHIGFDRKYPVSVEQLRQRVQYLGFKLLNGLPGSERGEYIVAARA
jgi:FkbM family methyltransferase